MYLCISRLGGRKEGRYLYIAHRSCIHIDTCPHQPRSMQGICDTMFTSGVTSLAPGRPAPSHSEKASQVFQPGVSEVTISPSLNTQREIAAGSVVSFCPESGH